MEAGLSKRMERTLNALLPTLTAAAPPPLYDPTTAIDLSSAQNEVIRPELLEFYKSTVEENVASQVFALPSLGLKGGDLQARDALASFFNAYFHPIHSIKSEHIALTAGGSDAVESLVHAVCDDGDSVIIPGPYWHGFDQILQPRANVKSIVAQPPSYEHWDNYLLPSIQAAYDFSTERSRIKAVILCNPHNPLSRCYPKDTLLGLMEFCQERDLHLIVDEMYALTDLNVDVEGPRFASALSLTDPFLPEGCVKIDPSLVHVVWSASKLFGMSGFRMGCVITQQNPHLLSAISLLTMHHTNSVAISYITSLLTWSQLPTLLDLNTERLTASCRLLTEALCSWDIDIVTPTHGIFLFAKLAKNAKSATDEKRFYNRLAVHGVRVAQGRFHKGVEGDYGWARIRFSVSPAVMRDALKRIEVFLSQAERAVEEVMGNF
ncbi:PLP-dependent transferase [Plenodomus tracheiphilus IPT5]|uniref:PLP-dependent transferase n=1 Tax=Plenodomus tracheiphilus IPT5 TaxID=1408161 RepID=A0A6A7BES0_9PLEO|nr:PLP-dependent transferase [Plenodomus tracheiphilus IPT5]